MNLLGNRKRLYGIALTLVALGVAAGTYTAFHVSDLNLVGTVDAHQVLVSPQVTGRVEKLFVGEGQEVQAGELIALLEGRELAAAHDSSSAQAGSLESQLQAAQASALSTLGEVTSGVANAGAALDMAVASSAEAAANRKRQEGLTQRTIALARQGAMSLQDQETAQQSLEALQARERSAEKAVEQAKAALQAAKSREFQAQAARRTVTSVEGQLRSARAVTSESEARLGYTRLHAPVSGRISTVVVREGEVVSAGAPVVALVDLSQTWVYVSLPETEADHVKVGDVLAVRMPGGSRIDGRVIAKATEAEFATQRDVSSEKRDIRCIRLKLLIPNPGGRFVPGMTAEAVIPASMRRRG
ncbi:HlyD family secretion protein [Geothrix sp. 21YS21S-4]|uniref:HlyD family secretion protein n=1 Tax=Geothrix sp. 21YS21S-4 TaxID=3068889 RepID=UPI0027B88724|nr:efflux RND transporter periplasmic adaptor subunit [Geothrix sp. 21YS21S-4]